MDVEAHLLAACVYAADLTPLADAALTADHFLNPASRELFQTITSHHATYGNVPSFTLLCEKHPGYPWPEKVEESVTFLIDSLIRDWRLYRLADHLRDAVDAWHAGSPDGATAALAKALSATAASSPATKTINVATGGAQRLDHYRSLSDRKGELLGITTGLSRIDEATGGFQPGQLITVCGWPKAGKSTLLMLMVMAAHTAGRTPLLLNFEMSLEEQAGRYDAIRAGIPHQRLRTAKLSDPEWQSLQQVLLEDQPVLPLWISADISGCSTVSGVRAKIDELKPDVCYVDGVYLMRDENGEKPNSPQALTNMTRSFKRLAQTVGIPIIIATQLLASKYTGTANRKVPVDAIARSSSFMEDSDLILGCLAPEDDPCRRTISIVNGRNAPPMEVDMWWSWEPPRFTELLQDPVGKGGGGWADDAF